MKTNLPLQVTLDIVHKDKNGKVINVQKHTHNTETDDIQKLKDFYDNLSDGEIKSNLEVLLKEMGVI